MSITRVFPVFAAAFAIIYVICVEANWALFTYHPRINEWEFLTRPAKSGPAMYWFGWMTTSAIAAGVVATIAAYLPANLTRNLPAAAAWVVPLLAMVTAVGLMINLYFFR